MSEATNEPFSPTEHPHIRFNPLKGDWILVSPQRMKRPWMGQLEEFAEENVPDFDAKNPLCPGVQRPNGKVNPRYQATFTFDNDFPALLPDSPAPKKSNDPLFQSKQAVGCCRVLCYHPKSNMTIPKMGEDEVVNIVEMWIKQQTELGRKYKWVQIFENRGAIMGCSNPHPHCQVWASNFVPNEIRIKDENQRKYYEEHNRLMLIDYVTQELEKKERVVIENEDWVVVVPYWAMWPFETMLLPRIHLKRITDLTDQNIINLAKVMKELTTRYDNLFRVSFPYTMGWHGAPTDTNEDTTHWVLHAVYYPPLLRSATVKKFMVGYELLAQGQRDLTPEQAAARLRDVSTEHYTVEKPNPE